MNHHFTPEALQNEEEFTLIEVVPYKQMKMFVIESVQKKSKLILLYGIIQFFFLAAAIVLLGLLVVQSIMSGHLSEPLKWYLLGIVCSFTLLIPFHELIHALAFWLLGKKKIGFGAQLRKFIFYAEANRQVMDKQEMIIVAFAPLVTIGLLSLACIICIPSPVSYLGVAIFLVHFLFCGGDMAIVSYFFSKKGIYSYDDHNERCSYFYQKKGEQVASVVSS